MARFTKTRKRGTGTVHTLKFCETLTGHYCGYVTFRRRPVIEKGYQGFLSYVPVHGGITYAEQKEEGMVYGFDCAHSGDERRPKLRNEEWLYDECRRLEIALKLARWFEPLYLLSQNNRWRARVLDVYHAHLRRRYDIQFRVDHNFVAMISLLCGRLQGEHVR